MLDLSNKIQAAGYHFPENSIECRSLIELFLSDYNLEQSISKDNLWLELLKPVEHSVNFCLSILRKSSETNEICANNGFHLIKVEQEKKIRLLRVTMQTDNYYFPRISLGPRRATISFMMINENNKFVQIKENISFVLDLCYI